VIAHASLAAFGEVQGGAETLLGALLAAAGRLMMPAFTYKTMLTPQVGPPDNGITYGADQDANLMAEFFHPGMPVDRTIGAVAEALRRHPRARRSSHPIQSFCGVNVDEVLRAQTIQDPLAPFGALAEQDGVVLLLGVNHTVNTSIHYAEKLAGRARFVRWALTPQGVVECPGFPGSSEGFEQIAPHLESVTRSVMLGSARVQAVPLQAVIETAVRLIRADPLALLPETSADERVWDTRKLAWRGNA
jgi:aminoglycoside 3-N-acetyltransferase